MMVVSRPLSLATSTPTIAIGSDTSAIPKKLGKYRKARVEEAEGTKNKVDHTKALASQCSMAPTQNTGGVTSQPLSRTVRVSLTKTYR